MNNEFYTYIYKRPDGIPFYVGKGKGNRVFKLQRRNEYFLNVINKYGKENVKIDIFFSSSDEESCKLEEFFIASFISQGIKLTNMTSGGETFKPTPELIEKLSKAHLGTIQTPESNEKRRKSLKGRPKNPESIKKSANTRRGIKRSSETSIKISEGNKRSWQLIRSRTYSKSHLKAHKKAMAKRRMRNLINRCLVDIPYISRAKIA